MVEGDANIALNSILESLENYRGDEGFHQAQSDDLDIAIHHTKKLLNCLRRREVPVVRRWHSIIGKSFQVGERRFPEEE